MTKLVDVSNHIKCQTYHQRERANRSSFDKLAPSYYPFSGFGALLRCVLLYTHIRTHSIRNFSSPKLHRNFFAPNIHLL